MNSAVRIIALAGASFILSFAGRVLAQDAAQVAIVDQRSAESLKGRKVSKFSALFPLGDKYLKPPPAEALRDALSTRATQPLSLVISELQLFDFIPTRRNSGPGGMITNSILQSLAKSKTDWSFIESLGIPNDEDAIICVFSGTANGNEIKLATVAPYKVSATALFVHKQQSYIDAFTSVYEQTAQKIIDQTGSAHASQ